MFGQCAVVCIFSKAAVCDLLIFDFPLIIVSGPDSFSNHSLVNQILVSRNIFFPRGTISISDRILKLQLIKIATIKITKYVQGLSQLIYLHLFLNRYM